MVKAKHRQPTPDASTIRLVPVVFRLSKALLPGGQVYKGIQKFAKQLEVELDDDEESKGMAPPARKQAKKSR